MEIEIKLTYDNKPEIVKIIDKLGFKKTDTKKIQDIYFGHNNDKLTNHQPFYRIRKIFNQYSEISLKDQFVNDSGIWSKRELNVKIDDWKSMVKILQSLNCRIIKKTITIKEIWNNNNTNIEFISIEKPIKMKYMEIESSSKREILSLTKMLSHYTTIAGEEIFSQFDRTNN